MREQELAAEATGHSEHVHRLQRQLAEARGESSDAAGLSEGLKAAEAGREEAKRKLAELEAKHAQLKEELNDLRQNPKGQHNRKAHPEGHRRRTTRRNAPRYQSAPHGEAASRRIISGQSCTLNDPLPSFRAFETWCRFLTPRPRQPPLQGSVTRYKWQLVIGLDSKKIPVDAT